MSLGEFLNQSIVTTLISLIGASFVAAYLSERWQRRSKMYDLRLNQIREIIEVYHKYVRLVKGNVSELHGKPFDDLHATLSSHNKLNLCMFKSRKIFDNWEHVCQNLASIRNERLHNKEIEWDEKMDDIRERSNEAINLMFKELI
jgi:L-rhamnose mutarotase